MFLWESNNLFTWLFKRYVSISNGSKLVNSNIISITKGEKGKPGEIKGSIDGQAKLGDISKNTSFGIFGKIDLKNTVTTNGWE